MYGNLLKSWVPDVLSGDPIITSSGLVYPGLCCIQVGWCIQDYVVSRLVGVYIQIARVNNVSVGKGGSAQRLR